MSNDSSPFDLAGLAIDPGTRDFALPSTDELRALGVRWIRYLVKQQFQNFDTGQNSELDLVIERYRNLGVKILVLVNAETIGDIIPAAHSDDWQTYHQHLADAAQKIAAFYHGKISAIEVFNEPDSSNVTADDYAALLSTVFPKIKAVSDVTVVLSGICCGLNHDYLKRVIDLAPNMFDFVGWHPYGLRVQGFPATDWGMGDLRDSLIRARAIAGKPLWLTEFGADLGYQWFGNPEQGVAEYLKRAYSLFRFLGSDVVAHAFWFTWKKWDEGWGLVDNSGNRRPAWYALQQQTGVVPPPPPAISRVSFSPTKLQMGESLNVSITVRNDAWNLLPTQGPEPGFFYDEGKNFYHYNFAEAPGNFRVGVEFDGRQGVDHPYRWGLGTPLAPGEERTITGAIRLTSAQSKNYWAGLVQERVAWHVDKQGTQTIVVEPIATNKPRITAAVFSPTMLAIGDFVHVSITVANDSGETLQTQGPEPGFVYDEGDDFRSRGFTETNGSFRVGVDFDGRSGIDHPYRWGLGAPLAPGETRTITGAIRMKNVQTKNYWAGLVQEQIAWQQDSQGVQRIAVSTTTGKPRITNVTFMPTTMSEPGTVNVSVTVENASNSVLETQGPPPGFVYDEGDTFYSRGFPDVARAFRVGIDFDNRTGIDHPYRWGLDSPLKPGETRTITGVIRFKRAQVKNFWAGLVQEQVMWVESAMGTQRVIVKPNVAPRVVHVHDLNATTWTGQPDYSSYVNQSVVNSMVERGITMATKTANAVNAWRAILPNYQPGQGIAIKINFTNGGNGNLDAPIQTVNAVIRGLFSIGVQANDIWVYSARDKISDAFVQACAYPSVRFFDNGAHELSTFDSAGPSATITFLSPSQVPQLPTIKLTDVLVNATYVINVPIFKAHMTGAGLTLGFKNHQGSHTNPSALHPYIFPGGIYFRADYNPLVDLYSNPNIGAKTVLTIGDGLFAGNAWNSPALMMQTFGSKPPNSLFFSTDPVAIDCVMADFIEAEWKLSVDSGNYLRLASEAGMGVYERGDPWGKGYVLIDYQKS